MVDRVEAIRRGYVPRKKAIEHPFIGIEHRVVDSPAFSDLNHSSVRVLLAVARQLKKDNNGHLQATWEWCKRYGIGSDNTLSSAVADLIAHGFLYRTKSHGANGAWAKYAVTWLPIKKPDGLFIAGFKMHAWRDWEAESKKTLPQKVRDTSRKNRGLRGELPAETAATLTAETAAYEYMLPCCLGEASQPDHPDDISAGQDRTDGGGLRLVPKTLAPCEDWMLGDIARLDKAGLAWLRCYEIGQSLRMAA